MKLTGEQVYEILQEFRKGDFVSLHDSNVQGRYLITSTYGIYTITEKLNKLLENEKGLKPEYIILTRMETIVDMIKIIAESITKTEDKINKEFLWIKLGLNKIQEQLTSFAGENISKQFALFLEKQAKRDSDILREIAILDEKIKQRWGDNYRVEFNIDPECGAGSVHFLVNDSIESIDDFHKKDNYESGRNTGIHALVTIDWDKFDESPQKETQEKSCATCGHFDIICKKDWCGDNYKGWQPKDNQVKLCVESFNTPSGKKDNQDESCKNCSIDKYCDGYCSGFQAKDNQESR